MANRVVPKNSNVASKVPLAGDLVRYEIALNSADKIIYFKDHNDLIQSIGGGGGSGDMLKSTYDTTDNGIVDNAEKVNGLTVLTAVPVNAVFTDTTYSVGNGGLTEINFTSALKTKLDGIEASANNYSHPTTDGNKHVPANGTNNSGKVLTAGASAGVYTWETPSSGGGLPAGGSQTFTSSGTFNVPAGIDRVLVVCYPSGGGGGGGASGGSYDADSASGGGGGGAGAMSNPTIPHLYDVSGASTVSVVIGAAGTGGAGGAAVCPNNTPGLAGSAGGTGGTSSFGTLNFPGISGGAGGTYPSTYADSGGNGGTGGGTNAETLKITRVPGSGAKGVSITTSTGSQYGAGGAGGAIGVGDTTLIGTAGSAGGSGGGSCSGAGGTGGNGVTGKIVVYW